MPDFGDIIYNIQDVYVAQLKADNTYGTPQKVEYVQQFSFEFESDEDEIKAEGMIVEVLAVPTKATGTLSNASLKWDAMAIVTGVNASTGGTTPTASEIIDFKVGGAGTPYFGIIMKGASTIGNVLIGAPKAKISTHPGFSQDQNTFRVSELGIHMIAPSTTVRVPVRVKKNETAANTPTDASGFDTFFSGLF